METKDVHLPDLFNALDARPFKPFTIEIISGRKVTVNHPDNIFIVPSRQKVSSIMVYQSDAEGTAIIWPEGIAAIILPENSSPSA